MLLQLQPRLVLQALDYAAAARTRAEALDAAAGGPCTLPLRQLVLEAFKRHGVPLSCSLGSLLPVIDLHCPGVSLVAPLRGVDTLEPAVTRASPAASASQETHRVSGTAAGGGGGGADDCSSSSNNNKNQQAPHRGEVRLIAQLSGLHAAVGYCSSCFGSLLQQVDATADLALSFEQPGAAGTAAAAALCAPYGAAWLHPDDAAQLQLSQPGQSVGPLGRRSLATNGGDGGGGVGVHNLSVAGQPAAAAASLGGSSLLKMTAPSVPLLHASRLWARMSAHVPTEPAVNGGEHTAAGLTAAGVLLWLSPWQLRLLSAAVDQLVLEAGSLWQRMMRNAAGPAAAADAAAAPGVVKLPQTQQVQQHTSSSSSRSSSLGTTAPSRATAGTSSNNSQRTSLSMLLDLPYCELLCFADLAACGGAADNGGGRSGSSKQSSARADGVTSHRCDLFCLVGLSLLPHSHSGDWGGGSMQLVVPVPPLLQHSFARGYNSWGQQLLLRP